MQQENKKQVSIFYRLLIHVAGTIVPRDQRSGWKQEWTAELSHRVSLLQKWQSLDLRNRIDLVRRCRGAFHDAGLLQMHQLQQGFIKDIRFGVRMLGKNIGFTSVAVLTLALAIGVNTAIFSVAYRLLANPLNIKDGQRVVYVNRTNPQMPGVTVAASVELIEQWRGRSKSFEAIEPVKGQQVDITGQGEPETVSAGVIAPTMFDFARLKTMIGRPFHADDVKPDAPLVVILSDGLWKRRYGADPEMIGRQIRLGEDSYTLIGIVPSSFTLDGTKCDAWLPLSLGRDTQTGFQAIARLRPEISMKQAQAEMTAISAQIPSDDLQTRKYCESG